LGFARQIKTAAGPYPVLEQLLLHVQLGDLVAGVARERQPARQQLVSDDACRPAKKAFV